MILGTVIKISSVIVVDGGGNPDSASVTIYNPDGTENVADAVMTQDGTTTTWYYVFQSSETGQEGLYEYIVEAASGVYTARSSSTFKLDEKPST